MYEILTNGSKVKFIGLQATNIVDKEHVLSFLNFFKNVKLVYFSAKEIIELDHPNFYCYKIEKSKDWKYDNLEWNSILSVDN
ncbi:hypothetical protein CPAV1605_1501 [seawater metagenome]|uniref:Uncharacterized protein n=1 Tax=seawater metagenome TaxID=1561972 RepID=A0A5E8CM76_9ZZZZ